MTASPLVLFGAAAMVGSLFLPWLNGPLDAGTVPWELLRQLDRSQIEQMLSDLPPEMMAFVGSFVLAALLVLLGFMGSAPRLLVLLTGAIPAGLLGWGVYNATQAAGRTSLPIPNGANLWDVLEGLTNIMGSGAWTWAGGGAALLLIGLFSPARR